MYTYIINPNNNKKIKLNSKLGIKILNNYIKQLGGKSNIYSPSKYFTGLTKLEKKKRLERMKEGKKSHHSDPIAYRDFETDFRNNKRIKTEPSKYTNQWRKFFPDATSLKSKSELTGVPLNIIKKVYARGLAAWRTGHRPGANSQQWGYARVHSFLVKGKTFYTTDLKLSLEAIKNSPKAKKWFDSVEGLCDNKKKKWCKKACLKIECKN